MHIWQFFYYVLYAFLLSACTDRLQYHDSTLKLTEDEVKAKLTPDTTKRIPPKALRAKALSPLQQKLSIHITPAISLRNVLLDIAAQTGLSLSVPNKILGHGINFIAKNQSAEQIIKGLCHMGKMRYAYCGYTLIIEPDAPHLKTYDIQFLLGSRKTENNLAITTSMQQHVGHNHSRSNTTISSVSEVNFWKELEATIKKILLLSHIADKKTEKEKIELNYSFHKQAGLLSVKCCQKQHHLIENYLKRLKKIIHTQVLIEAKIVEVSLKEQYESGINWDYLNQKLQAVAHYNGPSTSNPFGANILNGSGLRLQDSNLSAALKLMETFGSTQTIANPRLTVLNNQSAVFKVAENSVYFKLSTEHVFTAQNKPHFRTMSSEVQTVPIGLVLTVQPSINPHSEEVTLAIKPTISRVTDVKQDPAVEMQSNGSVHSEVPVVQVREMDSMVSLKPGEIVVMGGLIEKRSMGETSGLPGLRKTAFSSLIGGKKQAGETKELVIFLTVKVISRDPLHERDKMLYEEL